MANSIINLLQPRTVLVRAGKAVGTGSLIAPGKVLTCAHVVRRAIEAQEKIEVYLPDPTIPGQPIWTEEVKNISLSALYDEEEVQGEGDENLVRKTEYPDVAILEINRIDHEILKLPDYQSSITHTREQQFLAFGFQKKDRELGRNVPQAVSLNYSGEQLDGVIRKLMFSNGLIRPGMSGAPLMNAETGEVIGLVHMTMSPNDDLGAFAIPVQTVWNVIEQWSKNDESQILTILNSADHHNNVKKQYNKVFPKYPILQEYGWKIIVLPIILFFALWWMFFHRGPIQESGVIAILFVALAFMGNLLGDWLGTGVSNETSKMKSQIGPLIFNKYLLLSLSIITLGLWISFSSIWIYGNSEFPTTQVKLVKGGQKISEKILDPRGSTKFTFFSSPFGDSLTLIAGDREPIPIIAKSLSKISLYYPADFLLEPLVLFRFDGAFRRSMKKYQIEVTIKKMKDGELVKEISYIDSTLHDVGSFLIGNRTNFEVTNKHIINWTQSIESKNLNPAVQEIYVDHWKKVRQLSLPDFDMDIGDSIRIKVIKKSDGKIRYNNIHLIENNFTGKYLIFEL